MNNSAAVLSMSHDASFTMIESLEGTLGRHPVSFLFVAAISLAVVGLALFQSRVQVISFGESAPPPVIEIPERGGDVILVREPIPPGTVILLIVALTAFAAFWWNL
jgi:hypothetical protein